MENRKNWARGYEKSMLRAFARSRAKKIYNYINFWLPWIVVMLCRLCTDIKKEKKNSRFVIQVSLLKVFSKFFYVKYRLCLINKARTTLTGTHFQIILHCFVFWKWKYRFWKFKDSCQPFWFSLPSIESLKNNLFAQWK